MHAHIATESRHRDSTATAAGPESRRAYQPSAPATAMMQSRRQPFRLSAHNHTFTRTCASSLAYNMRSAAEEAGDKGRDGWWIRPCPWRPVPAPAPTLINTVLLKAPLSNSNFNFLTCLWLAGSSAPSQSEAMLENNRPLATILTGNPISSPVPGILGSSRKSSGRSPPDDLVGDCSRIAPMPVRHTEGPLPLPGNLELGHSSWCWN